jgi:hypothetical protein
VEFLQDSWQARQVLVMEAMMMVASRAAQGSQTTSS